MSYNESEADRQDNTSVPAPRYRLNITSALNLSTTWQRLDFAGLSNLNINTFSLSSDGVNKMVYWDSSTKLFMFMAQSDRNYDINFNIRMSSSSVLSLLNVTIANIQLRYVVPVPGSPIYFPLPDTDQCVNLGKAGLIATDNSNDNRVVYANSSIRQYGLGMEMRISNNYLGTATATLNAADIIIYGR